MNRLSRLGPAAQTIAFLAALVGFVGIATGSAWPIYDVPRVAIVAAGGLIAAVALAMAARVLAWRWWITAPVALVLYALIAVPLAIPSALSDPGRAARGVGDAVVGIVVEWKRLTTVSLPAGDYQAVLVPFLVTVFACALVATVLALRGGRAAPWAAAPLVAMTLFGPIFGSSEEGASFTLGPVTVPAIRHVVWGVAAVGLALAWLVIRTRIERVAALRVARAQASTVRQSSASLFMTLRRQVAAGVLALVAVGAGVAAAPVADALTPRSSARDAVEPVLMLAAQPSPLSSYRGYFTADAYDAPLFTVAGASNADRLRIAVLDTYDGVTFHVASDAEASRFARQPGHQDGSLTITIDEGYRGVWVPIVTAEGGMPDFMGPRAEELSDAYYASSALDAAVVVTGDSAEGVGLVAGDSYRIAVPTSTPATGAFETATGGDPLVSADAYPSLAAWVDRQEAGRTGADLIDLVERLRERGYVSHASAEGTATAAWESALPGYEFEPSRPGHTTAHVDALFADLVEQEIRAGATASDSQLVAAVGDDEQFATAAALLARYLGFESRVVLGVRLGAAPDGSPVPACTDVCTGANMTAWAEVRTPAGTWLPLDASPQFAQPPLRIRQGETPPRNPTVPEVPETTALEPPSSVSDATVTSDDPTPANQDDATVVSRTIVLAASAALALGLLALPLSIFPVAKSARRRSRRRAVVPEVAMVGAWSELLDAYADAGIEVPQRLTRTETADLLERPAAAMVATIVDRAVFAEHPPTGDASSATWEIVDEELRAVRAELSWHQRVRAAFTPRSFLDGMRLRGADHDPTITSGRSRDARR